MAALAVAGAVAGSGAGARERGLCAALGPRGKGGDGERGKQRGGRMLAGTLQRPSKGAELGIQRLSAWPRAGRGRGREREV